MWPFKPKKAPIKRVEPQILRVRRFKAAEHDRLKASWSSQPLTINEIIKRDLRTLRARSRAQGESDPYARRFLQMCRSHVIGPDGIRLQARLTRPDGTLDQAANQAIETAWKRWGRAEFCHMQQQIGLAEFQRQAIATIAEDGECLIRLITGRQAGPYGLALQFIDVERLDVKLDREATRTQNAIRMGVEIDDWQRPVAYWFSSAEGDYYYAGRQYIRIPAAEIIHAFLPFRSGAWRGVPWNATALVRLHMLDGYEDAALVNARAGANNVGFFLTEDGLAPMGEEGPDLHQLEVSSESGEYLTLPGSVRDFKAFSSEYPSGEFPTFVKQILRGVSAGLGVSYHALSGDLESVNFSSGRLGAMEDREMWKALQNWFIDTVMTRLFNVWIESALLKRQIPGVDILRLDEIQRAATWQPRRWQHIQPREEMAANELALKLRLRSRSEIIRETGNDPDDVWREIEAENQTLTALGIDPALEQPAPANTDPSRAKARSYLPPQAAA